MTSGLKSSASKSNFEQQLLACLKRLRAYASSLTRNAAEADDIVQQTIMIAWERQAALRDAEAFVPWIMTILRNEFFMRVRRAGREIEDIDGTYSENCAVEAHQEVATEFADVMSALHRLPFDQREALTLVFVDQLSYEDAAEVCKCSIGTIKSRISRGRSRLQLELDKNNSESSHSAAYKSCTDALASL